MNPREMIRAHAYPTLALVSTISLTVIATSLVPVAKWMNIQNQCVERILKIDANNMPALSSQVWSCNGKGS